MRDGGGSAPTLDGLPWPEGDPGQLTGAAQRAHAAARTLGHAASSLGSHAHGSSGWRGAAAAAFRHTIQAEQQGMQRSAAALDEASSALRRLGEVLGDGQQEVRRLAEQVCEAEAAAAVAGVHAALAVTQDIGVSILTGADPAFREARREADDAADHARDESARANAHATEVRSRATRRAQQVCDHLVGVDVATARAVDHAAALAPMGGRTHSLAATPAHAFGARVFKDLSRSDWEQLAYFLAGIEHWDPAEGLLANDANVRAVYAFYGQLWSGDHDLQWAGMANLVGPLFYAGWQDLYLLRTMSDGGDRLKYLTRMLGLPNLPGIAYGAADLAQDLTPAGLLADLSGEELEWFEQRFLSMQKQIFDDMAWKHAAYSLGGIDLMREMHDGGQLSPRELAPFEQIASGVPERVRAGNEALLYREQRNIIQNDYDALRDHDGPIGEGFSTMLTWTANNPIPGGHAYRDDFHHNAEIPVPLPGPIGIFVHPHVSIPVQVPTGNVADFDDRWRWITQDMLPNYQQLLTDPQAMAHIVDEPVAERADDWRMVPLPYPGG